MFTLPEQFSAATKANIDAQLAMFTAFTSKAMEGVEKMVELNITAAKTSSEEFQAMAKQLLSAKDAQEFINLTTASAQPNTEKLLGFAQNCASIVTSTGTEFTKETEKHAAELNRKVVSFIDELAKNAPAGTENGIAMFKSAFGTANAALEQGTKAVKQVAEQIETNVNTAVSQISKSTATTRSKKAN